MTRIGIFQNDFVIDQIVKVFLGRICEIYLFITMENPPESTSDKKAVEFRKKNTSFVLKFVQNERIDRNFFQRSCDMLSYRKTNERNTDNAGGILIEPMKFCCLLLKIPECVYKIKIHEKSVATRH